ncbi:MAG: tocopherol cyclase family protein, partial [Chitinophagales bacterium]
RQAFIQILDGKAYTATYHQFHGDAFSANPDFFEIKMDANTFSLNAMVLNIADIAGTVTFSDHHLWPKKKTAPGIMGWYAFVPFMECYHQVVSMDFQLHGSLQIKNTIIDFSHGKGYLEKDWGRSFPSSWIWMQSNHFTAGKTSFKLSIAKIPWLGSHFIGFICAFLLDGKLYRFATYTGAKLAYVDVTDSTVNVELADKRLHLKVTAQKAEGAELVSPILGLMNGRVKESMDATMYVILKDRKTGNILFAQTGVHAGLEIAGNISEILQGYKN